MEYTNLVRDFAVRTRHNLRLVQEAAKRTPDPAVPQVYEVTQLINSLLGLLVFPQQACFQAIPKIPLDELVRQGWPRIKASPRFSSEVRTLDKLMRYLRNAIAHFHLTFMVGEDCQISGIHVWNEIPDGITNWEADLTLRELQVITDRFIDLLLSPEG